MRQSPSRKWVSDSYQIPLADTIFLTGPIITSMMSDELPKTFDQAMTAQFLLEHSLELYLKGAIRSATGTHPTVHDLAILNAEYNRVFPEPEFRFEGRIAEAVAKYPESSHSLFPRYPIKTNGSPWDSEHNSLTLETWDDVTLAFQSDLKRLVSTVEDSH